MFGLLFAGIFYLAWNIVKALVFILVTYIVYKIVAECVKFVWEIIHPSSLERLKDKWSKKKKI